MAKLTFVLEDGQEVVVPLKEHITIGRGEDNDIVVDDDRLSQHHAEILLNADGSFQVFDLKSTAGTFVNGERQLSCPLLHGDTIAFGPLVGTLDLEEPAAPAAVPPASSPPPAAPATAPTDNPHAADMAKWEAEKNKLKAEAEAAAKELRDWQQRAEKERAMHLARVESLQAQEKKLAPTKAAVEQAENAHREWLESISALAAQHADKTAALERLNAQHYEKSTEVQRLAAATAASQQELEMLAAQKDETAARLNQVRDECVQDEALLNSLRQQIIEHEKRIVEEEAKHAALTSSTQELSTKHQRDEAAVKDLEKLLMELEQRGAAAEGSLQRMQNDLASCEKDLAARKAELATCEKSIASRSADLLAETNRLAEAKSKRAELEQLNQEVAATKQQLADARQRLAAVEQRYRDAQAVAAQVPSQLAGPRRHAAHEEAPSKAPAPAPAPAAAAAAADAEHVELAGKIEAARHELAELETKIASLRQSQSTPETAPNAATIPQPRIVHVETIRLAPIPIKSERTRGPGTKQPATAGVGKKR